MKKISVIFLLFFTTVVFATHNRAGELTYTHISGFTYEITATIYTDASSPSVRPYLDFLICGGIIDSVPLSSSVFFGNNTLKNTYVVQHTFAGSSPFICTISIEDPNRTVGIVNIPNSVNTIFYLEAELLINPFLGANNSPVFLTQNSVDTACINIINGYNYSGFDVDGDSLYYSLDSSKVQGGIPVVGYQIPSASTSFSLNNITGELIWDTPNFQGIFNFVIKIEEFRSEIKIGSVSREIQIEVKPNCSIVGVKNLTSQKSNIEFFPNPTQDKIKYKAEQKITTVELVLMNSLGKINAVKFYFEDYFLELDMNNLPLGLYTLIGHINNEIFVQKIIKQ